MPAQAPPLEETKAVILQQKGQKWLSEQEKKFDATYGSSVKDPAFKLWLIAKQNGIEVTEIKASSNGADGESVAVAEIAEKAKSPKDHGWTFVNGGVFEKPEHQDKYSIRGVILSIEDKGETKNGGAKKDYFFTDGTGIAKVGANTGAVDAMTEAKVRPGTVLRLPLVNINYGYHNFGATPNQLWWKFSLPPFDEAAPIVLNEDPKQFFLNLESDVVKENMPCSLTGFITHLEENTVEVCDLDGKWITEKETHDECRDKPKFATHEETTWQGTATSLNGQTAKLRFDAKPKIRVAVDLVEIFGRMNKKNSIEVAFTRKPGAEHVEVGTAGPTIPAAKPSPAKVTPKPMAKKAPTPPPVTSDAEQAQDTEEASVEDDEPAPVPAKANPNAAAAAARKAALKAFQDQQAAEAAAEAEDVEETADEAPEPQVVVKKAAKAPAPAKVAAKAAAATVQVEEPAEAIEVPEAFLKHVEKSCKQFGGKNMVFVIRRSAAKTGLLGEGASEEDPAVIAQVGAWVDAIVAQGLAEYDNAQTKRGIKWLG